MLRKLLRQIYGAVLAAGTAERNHQIFKAATLILANAGIDQRADVVKKLVRTFLLIEIFDDRRIFSGEALETLFPPGIGNAAAVEYEAAAISGLIFRYAAVVKRKTVYPHREGGVGRNVGRFSP